MRAFAWVVVAVAITSFATSRRPASFPATGAHGVSPKMLGAVFVDP